MACGIYKLNFPNTNLVYIGQSKNISRRYSHHLSHFRKLDVTRVDLSKLEWAYVQYGNPTYEVLLECKESELNYNEIYFISLYSSYDKGLNSTPGGGDSPRLSGIDNPNSLYKEEDYFNVLYFLGQPGYTIKEIAEITGVSKYVISHIAAEESHLWLKDKYPKEYLDMQKLSEKTIQGAERGKVYPLVKSPSGEIFSITHQTNFAKEHGLLQPKLNEIIKGTRKYHKGWSLA